MFSYLRGTGVLSALLCASVWRPAQALTGDSACSSTICLNATVHDDLVHWEITNEKEPLGWMAIGFGRYMRGTHMVVVWPNEDGSFTVSQRRAKGHYLPWYNPDPPAVATLATPLGKAWHPDNLTTISFTMPVDNPLIKNNSEVDLIWAWGKHPPRSSAQNSSFGIHSMMGSLKFDLTKDVDDSLFEDHDIHDGDGSGSGSAMLVPFHGILLSIGFLLLLPTGSLLARYSRSFTNKWFPFHQAINFYAALPVILIGWILGPIAVKQHHSEHFADTHQTFGFVVLAFYICQVWLGWDIHLRRAQGRGTAPHPPLNILHAALGVSIILMAFFQVNTGIGKYEAFHGQLSKALHSLYNAWILVIPLLYIAGLLLLPKQFRQEKASSADTPLPSHYTPLSSEADQDPLLGDIHGKFLDDEDDSTAELGPHKDVGAS